jgi:hypothetical protein
MFLRFLSMVVAVQICLFWLASAHMKHVLAETTAQLAESQPLVLAGVTIRFERVTAQLAGSARLNDSAFVKRYLLFVSADNCAPSRRIAPAWRELLDRVTFRPDDRVVLVTFGGTQNFTEMVPVLERRGIRYVVAEATSVPEFAMQTGVRATPFLAVLDHDHHLELSSYTMSPKIVSLVASRFKGWAQ